MMTLLARILATLCAVVFVPVAGLAIFSYSLGTRFAQPEPYRAALAQAGAYAKFPEVAAEVAVKAARDSKPKEGEAAGPTAALGKLTREDWVALLRPLASAAYLQGETERLLRDWFAALHGHLPENAGQVELAEFKRRLVAPEFEAAYLQMLANKPACSDEQLSAAGGLPVDCRPSADQLPAVREAFRGLVKTAAASLPDHYDTFAGMRETGSAGAASLQEAREDVADLEHLARLSLLLPTILLMLIAAFSVRSIKGLLLWCGTPCLLAGALTALLSWPTLAITNWFFLSFVKPQLPVDVPIATAQVGIDFLAALLGQMLRPVLETGGAMALCGLVAVVLGCFLPSRAAPPPPATKAP